MTSTGPTARRDHGPRGPTATSPTRLGAVLALALALVAPASAQLSEVTSEGLAGTGGLVPSLTLEGFLGPGTLNTVRLAEALPGAPAALVLGFSDLSLPFKGGVLGPALDVLVTGLPVSGDGGLDLPFVVPQGTPGGLSLWAQLWIGDPGAVAGFAASNTLRLVLQPPSVGPFYRGLVRELAGQPEALAILDVDRDGLDDLVTVETLFDEGVQARLSVRLSAGGVVLEPADTTILPAADVRKLLPARLNADGFADLVVMRTAFNGPDRVEVRLGTGTGFPTALPVFTVGGTFGPELIDVAVADLDDDGEDDLVLLVEATTVGDSAEVLVFLGEGDGAFDTLTVHPVALTPASLAVGEVDGDGLPDVLVGSEDEAQVALLSSLGGGDLAAPLTVVGGPRASALVLVDADQDGDLDLGVFDDQPDLLHTHPGTGLGTFGSPAQVGLPNATSFVLADVDGDGSDDLVSGVRVASDWLATVLAASPGQLFTTQRRVLVTQAIDRLAVGDLSGNGVADLALGHGGDVGQLLGRPGPFPWTDLATVAVLPGTEAPATLLAADLTGDGVDELINVTAGGPVKVWQVQPDGTQVLLQDLAVDCCTDGTGGAALADMDGDGLTDLVVGRRQPDTLWVLRGQASGGLQASGATLQQVTPGSTQETVSLGDLDGDGRPDVVLANQQLDALEVVLNDGAGGLSPPTLQPTFLLPRYTALGDLDGDGDLDVLSSHTLSERLVVSRGDGAGGLSQFAVYAEGGTTGLPLLDDRDGDGDLDVLVGVGGVGLVLRPGLGTGALGAPTVVAPESPTDPMLVDLDGDGWEDLVYDAFPNLAVRRGDASGLAFGLRELLDVPGRDRLVADLDGDGGLDLVTYDSSAGGPILLLRQD